jgi:hypothetical protein
MVGFCHNSSSCYFATEIGLTLMRFYRGISVPRDEEENIITKICSRGLQPGGRRITLTFNFLIGARAYSELAQPKLTILFIHQRPDRIGRRIEGGAHAI